MYQSPQKTNSSFTNFKIRISRILGNRISPLYSYNKSCGVAMPQRAKIGVGDKLVWVWHKIWANHSHSSRKLIPLRWQKSMLWNRQRVESLTCGSGERAGNNGYKTTSWRAPLTVNMVLYTTPSKHRKQWRKRKRLRNTHKKWRNCKLLPDGEHGFYTPNRRNRKTKTKQTKKWM